MLVYITLLKSLDVTRFEKSEQFDILAPSEYLTAPRAFIEEIVNGCGPKGGWKIDLVPDNIWGLDISECCNVHDWMYEFGETEDDRLEADLLFLYNIRSLVAKQDCNPVRKFIRNRLAGGYYRVVRRLGKEPFNDKEIRDKKL